MFGLGVQELIVLAFCFGFPPLIGGTVLLVLVLRRKPSGRDEYDDE